MTALLMKHWPLVAGAPDGVKKLRSLILDLAMRGRLAQRDPKSESGKTLIARISEERKRLKLTEGLRNSSVTQLVTEIEPPHDLPENWVWARLQSLYHPIAIRGNQLLSSEIAEQGRFPVVDQGKRSIAGFTDREELVIYLSGPVVVFGDHTTERKYVDFDFVAGADGVKILRPLLMNERFFWWQLVNLKIESRGYARHFKVLNDCLFALPPREEQDRIVAKVDELMALCDRLEADQADAEAAHAQLVKALLDSLTQATDAADFQASWQRLSEHFHTLFTTEASIDALKQAVLQLGVMGKLVPQSECTESVEGLLHRLSHFHSKPATKSSKHSPRLSEQVFEPPFPLPTEWRWVRLGELLSKIGAGSTPLGGKQSYVDYGVKFLRSQNVWNAGLNLDNVAYISEETHKKMSGTHVSAGDILFNITGASIGRCTIVPNDFDTGNVSQHVTILRPYMPEICEYLHIALMSKLVQSTVMSVQVGVSREGLSIGKLAQFLIPLPPVEEQQRIAMKIAEINKLCDELKSLITNASQRNEKLAALLIEQATTSSATNEKKCVRCPSNTQSGK